jgi:hypothetical protein
VVLALQTDVLLPSSRQSANDQLAWLTLPQVTKQSLVDWLDEVLPDVAQAVNCYGESGLAIAASASEMTLLGGRDAGVYQGPAHGHISHQSSLECSWFGAIPHRCRFGRSHRGWASKRDLNDVCWTQSKRYRRYDGRAHCSIYPITCAERGK